MRRFAVILLLGCSSKSSETAPPVETYTPPPATMVVETGIVRELMDVDGVVPPKNPVRSAETPKEQNKVRVVRYRAEANKAPRAVMVLMPGFLGGAGSFDPLARAMVRRSLNDPAGAIEAWAIDRRSNYLEDTHGDDVAEVKKDPSYAERYYFEGETIFGKTFAGYIDQANLPHMSEWGAEVTLGDLRNVIKRAPAKVVLVGHSLGATLAEAYASWDFAGARGYSDLAGLVMIDGVGGRELDPATGFDEKTYLAGATDSTNPISNVGLDVIRKSQPYVALPFIGVAALENAERMAIATAFAPTAPRLDHDDITNLSAILFGLDRKKIPKMTNRAAFGLAFDDKSTAVFFAAISGGQLTGGAIGTYKGILGGESLHPTDPAASYDWLDFDQATPVEHTRLSDMARSWYEGPGLNFGEWYFPARLALDAGVVGSMNIAEDDWRTKYGLRARYGADIDIPVLAFAAGLTGENGGKRYDKLKAMLTKAKSYQFILRPQFTHIDPIQAADIGEGKVWFDELYAFVTASTPKI